jgi:hypothetical protein
LNRSPIKTCANTLMSPDGFAVMLVGPPAKSWAPALPHEPQLRPFSLQAITSPAPSEISIWTGASPKKIASVA